MASIVDYNSSSSEEEEDLGQLKRKASSDLVSENTKLPKLPSFFEPQLPTPTPTNDEKHKGRVRAVSHRHDSWATYVYCKVNLSSELECLTDYLNGLEPIEEQHISLCRPVYLRKHQLDSFAQAVSNALQGIACFDIAFAQLAPLTNDEKTRSFMTLEVGKGYNELMHCMKCIDKVMTQFHKPVFYDPPRFHTSIAWSLEQSKIESLCIPPKAIDPIVDQNFFISKIYIKMGNRVEQVSLS
ncbi:hypothetical protein BD560DRAFT_3784 [Blakeslea trispora]|nr:hypothetical protein BD560DRAFT_3784 [Blakeslea trispora]